MPRDVRKDGPKSIHLIDDRSS